MGILAWLKREVWKDSAEKRVKVKPDSPLSSFNSKGLNPNFQMPFFLSMVTGAFSLFSSLFSLVCVCFFFIFLFPSGLFSCHAV